MYKRRLLVLGLGAVLFTSCSGDNSSKDGENEADAAVIEQADSTAKAMDNLQAEIEAKRAELEEAVKAIEEDEEAE